MKYITSLFIIIVGYYSFTYAIYLWKKQNNKLGAFGVAVIALIGTLIPIFTLFTKL